MRYWIIKERVWLEVKVILKVGQSVYNSEAVILGTDTIVRMQDYGFTSEKNIAEVLTHWNSYLERFEDPNSSIITILPTLYKLLKS